MHQGYIKLHRQLQDSWIWKESEPFDKRSAWLDMLLMANYSDKKIMIDGELVTIHKGQFHTSILKLSEKWKWDRKKTTRLLNVLEGDNMIITNRTSKGTTITIVNWDKYQVDGTTDGASDGQREGQLVDNGRDNRRDTNKNNKEYKKNNNIKVYVSDGTLNSWIIEFVNHRKKLKKPMTDRAVELFVNRLNNLCPNNIGGQIELIKTAIERGWQTVYPSKEKQEEIKSPGGSEKLKALEDFYIKEG